MSGRNSTKVERVCLTCNSKFFVWPSQVKDKGGFYCNRKCKTVGMRKQFSIPIEDRFWKHVDKGNGTMRECWLWTGATDGRWGYGHVIVNGVQRKAQRVSYELMVGPVPDGMCVLHDCPTGDDPRCVNPSHLWLGTKGDNNRDREAKGRGRQCKGENNGRSKLTEDQVREIRAKYATGNYTFLALAPEYGVSNVAIRLVCRRITYTHVA